MAKSGRLELGDKIYGHYKSIFNNSTSVTYLARKAIKLGEKRKIRAITPFVVIQGHQGWYQRKARMRLPIGDWHISYRFGVIAAYCSNFGHSAFLSHPWGA